MLASGPEFIDDFRKAPDHVLSLSAAIIEVRTLPGMLTPVMTIMPGPATRLYTGHIGYR